MISQNERFQGEESLRRTHADLTGELASTQGERAGRDKLELRIANITFAIRDMLHLECCGSMCAFPGCIARATLTVNDERWCGAHAPREGASTKGT